MVKIILDLMWRVQKLFSSDSQKIFDGIYDEKYLIPLFPISADPTGPGPCALILTGISAILILLTLPLSLIACVKVSHSFIILLAKNFRISPANLCEECTLLLQTNTTLHTLNLINPHLRTFLLSIL